MQRKLYTARLERKECISESAQCYHFDFAIDELDSFPFSPGQFVSTVAPDSNGKQQTRAYSIASAPRANHFDLCVNRVEGGFFSNHLADLSDLPPGGAVSLHGPHGHFVLKEPLTDSIFIATGTGIAPMRGFTQFLFPEDGPDRSGGKEIWLVYGTRHETELYYHDEFEALAARKPNFHYLATLSRATDKWTGLRGYVQEHVARIVEKRAARLGQKLPLEPVPAGTPATELNFDIYAYICGLNNMVSGVREKLAGYGWHRKQIIFERYD
ncbi:FAD-dependent oxidoreductase [Acidobacteria bacterium AB60]|nr:FAD-dependent oxidoreductase [Acidobacteria bacterium AB60]